MYEYPPFVSVCGRMSNLFAYSSWCPEQTGYCLRLFEHEPRPVLDSGPPVTAQPCDASASQQWNWSSSAGAIKSSHIVDACITASLDMQPSAGKNQASRAAVFLGKCTDTSGLLGTTQTFEIGPVATSGGWLEAMVDDQESQHCLELDVSSKGFGAIDTLKCTRGQNNIAWHAPGDGTLRLRNITREIPCYCSYCAGKTCPYCCNATGSAPGFCDTGSVNMCPKEQPVCSGFRPGCVYGYCGPHAAPKDLCLTASDVPLAPPPAPLPPAPFVELIAFGSDALPGTKLKTLRRQRLPAGFDVQDWHSLELSFSGSKISVAVDGGSAWSTSVTDHTFDSGMAGIGSGWNQAYYDELKVTPAAAIGRQDGPSEGVVLNCISTGIGLTALNETQGDRWAGVALRATQSVKVVALARFQSVGNSQQHNVSLFRLSTGGLVASGTVDMSNGVPDATGMIWAKLATTVTLTPGEYVVASQEHVGGDKFYGHRPPAPLCGVTNVRNGAPWVQQTGAHGKIELLGATSRAVSADEWRPWQVEASWGPVNLAVL